MLNPATHPTKFNEFTKYLKDNPNTLVRLRDGTCVTPIFVPAEDETCEDAFFTENYSHCWNTDGTSVTRRSLDMMETINPFT